MSQAPRFRPDSLLADEERQQVAPVPPKRPRWDRRVDARVRAAAAAVWSRPSLRRASGVAAGVLAVGVAVGTYLVLRPVPRPDFSTADIDVLFDYTLLTEEFNKLPIEKRLELIAELVARLKGIDADQSLLMAAFAAQISGQVREQFEKNASLLAVDLFDKYAQDFNTGAPPDERDRYVENTFVEFQKTIEKLAGEERSLSDEDRLIEGRRQAQRDLDFVQSGRMPIENTVRMISFLNQGVGQHASGHQKIRINGMISQMVKTLREGEVPPEPEREQPRRRRDREQPPTEPTAPGTAPGEQPPAEQPTDPPAPSDEDKPPEGKPAETKPDTDPGDPGKTDDDDGGP